MLVIILILIILNNFLINSTYAADGVNDLGDLIGGLFSGVVGILTYIYRAPVVAIGWLINKFMATLAYAEGSTDPSAGGFFDSLTVFDVLFTRPKLIDINFFDIVDGDTSLVNQFRINVAAWFYIMRTLSAGILLVILVYIGIRMATSTIASDRAMYKRMLADWAVSLVLIFILNYIIIFTIEINNALVRSLSVLEESSGLSEAIDKFGSKGINPFGGIPSIVAAIIYIMLIWQTLGLFFAYFNRMLKVAFLIIIAPLISLTYSIDKIGDGKAQALDAWLKEFVFTILMQPFHCVIYLSLISTSMNILQNRSNWNNVSETLGAGILAITCVLFTREAEKIVRKIFGFKDDNKSTSLVAGAMLASTALNKAKSAGSSTAKFAQGTKNFLKNTPDALRLTNLKAEAKAAVRYIRGKDSDGKVTDKDYATLRSEARTQEFDKAANKLEEALGTAKKGKDLSEETLKRADEIKAKVEEIKSDNPGIDKAEAEAMAKFYVNKKTVSDRGSKRHPILTTKGAIRKVTSMPGKIYKSARGGLHDISEALPMSATRALLAGEIKKAPGMVVGAGMLGTTGKVTNAIAGYTAANKFVEGLSKQSKGTIIRDLEKSTQAHSSPDKAGIIKKVRANPEDYDFKNGIPQKLQDIISELNSVLGSKNALDPTEVVNTIENNPKDAGSKLAKLIAKYDTNGSAGKAGEALANYGYEYSASQSLAAASEVGIPMGELIEAVGGSQGLEGIEEVERYVTVPTSSKDVIQSKVQHLKNMRIADEFAQTIENKNGEEHYENVVGDVGLITSRKSVTTEEKVSQLAALSAELQKVIDSRQKFEQTSDDKFKKKTEELERKKALIIGKAVSEIENANEAAVEAFRTKIITEIGGLLSKEYDESDKKELTDLKDKLENIGKQNS